MARISLLTPESTSLETRGYYQMSATTWGILSNLIMTLGHCPEITKTLVPFANSFIFFPIKGNNIDRKLRELIINKVSRHNESHYSITHHTLIAINEGVDYKKLLDLDLDNWKASKVYSEREKLAIEYAELGSEDSNGVSDEFFTKIKQNFTEPEIIEMTVLIGHFNLLNRWFNALQVEDEPEFLKFYYEKIPQELQTSISYHKPKRQLTKNEYTLKRPVFIDKKSRVPPLEPEQLEKEEDFATLASYELARLSWRAGTIQDKEPYKMIPNLIKTWGQCREIARTEVQFVNSFAFNKDSTIDRGLKELAINIVGRINQSYYSSSAHEWYAKQFGKISEEQLNELEKWDASKLFDQTQKLVIEYAIEVTVNSNFISDELFSRLKKRFTESEVVELTFLIAHYQHVTRFINLLQIELEEGRKPK